MTVEEIINKLNISIIVLDSAIDIPETPSRIRAAYSNVNTTLGELLASDESIPYAVFTILNNVRRYKDQHIVAELIRFRIAMAAILDLLEPLVGSSKSSKVTKVEEELQWDK